MYPSDNAALYIIAKTWKQPKCLSTEEQIKMHNEILLTIKKNKIMSLMTPWMDLQTIMLSKISETEKDKYI